MARRGVCLQKVSRFFCRNGGGTWGPLASMRPRPAPLQGSQGVSALPLEAAPLSLAQDETGSSATCPWDSSHSGMWGSLRNVGITQECGGHSGMWASTCELGLASPSGPLTSQERPADRRRGSGLTGGVE